jgi:hypothetical protein
MFKLNWANRPLDWPKFAAVASIAIFLACINAILVMWCWNLFLVPAITGFNEIDFIQSLGITGLCGILFKDNGFRASFK